MKRKLLHQPPPPPPGLQPRNYKGILIKHPELYDLQHQFRDKIKSAHRLADSAILVEFRNGSKNYTPSRKYSRVKSQHYSLLKHTVPYALKYSKPEERKEHILRYKQGDKGDYIVVVSQRPCTIVLPARTWKVLDKIWQLLFYKRISDTN
jgi:hypothetical protein